MIAHYPKCNSLDRNSCKCSNYRFLHDLGYYNVNHRTMHLVKTC